MIATQHRRHFCFLIPPRGIIVDTEAIVNGGVKDAYSAVGIWKVMVPMVLYEITNLHEIG